jgi:murein DD-endopeptidase MepM/ murein hydrolase activator NlpD
METSEHSSNAPEKSTHIYELPFSRNTKISGVEYYPAEGTHTGSFAGAIDFIVPIGTPILSPSEGVVVEVVDKNKKYGKEEKYRKNLNFITIRNGNEYVQIAHLAKGSAKVKVGDFVYQHMEVAESGRSGQMSKDHVHLLVFKAADTSEGFVGLEAQFQEYTNALLKSVRK